eukprot:19470_1
MWLFKYLFFALIILQRGNCSILPWDWNSVEWNNNLRSAAVLITSQLNPDDIPIGTVVSIIISIIWPEESSDNGIWDQMSIEMKAIVNQAILTDKLEDFNADLLDIQDAMNEYNYSLAAKDLVNANAHLNHALDSCDDLKNHVNLSQANNDYLQLFSVMVPLASLHLSNLREQYVYGYKLNDGIIDPQWKIELNDTYYYYKNWFEWYYPSWYKMRSNSISVSYDKNTYTAHDSLSGVTLKQNTHDMNNEALIKTIAVGSKDAMLNEARGYMFALLTSTFYIHHYVPWLSNTTTSNKSAIIPNFANESIRLGPYAYWNVKNSNSDPICGQTDARPDTTARFQVDEPGIIKAVTGKYYNSFDKLQLIYTTHDGKYTGDGGGKPFSWPINYENNYITSMWIKFGNPTAIPGIMTAISVGYNNYTISGQIGNLGGWKGASTNVTIGNEWQLVSIAQLGGMGPSQTDGTGAIYFDFMHYTLVDTLV